MLPLKFTYLYQTKKICFEFIPVKLMRNEPGISSVNCHATDFISELAMCTFRYNQEVTLDRLTVI